MSSYERKQDGLKIAKKTKKNHNNNNIRLNTLFWELKFPTKWLDQMHGIGICLRMICIGFNLILSLSTVQPKNVPLPETSDNKRSSCRPAVWPYSHCERLLPFGSVCIIAFVSSLWLSIHSDLHIWTWPKPVPFVFSQFCGKNYKRKYTAVKLLITYILKQPLLRLTFMKIYTCDLQLGLHGSSITVQALLPHQ